MSNYLNFEIFDTVHDYVELSLDREKIYFEYKKNNLIEYFSLLSKLSKYCRKSANEIYNYPVREIFAIYQGNAMTHSIYLSSKDIWNYKEAYEEIIGFNGSASLWDVQTGLKIIGSEKYLSIEKGLVQRNTKTDYKPEEYFSNTDLQLFYEQLKKNRILNDYEIKSHITIDLDNKEIPRQELPFYNIGITANYVLVEGKECVLGRYQFK